MKHEKKEAKKVTVFERLLEGINYRNYKVFLAIPMLLLIISVAVLVSGYMSTGEWFKRSIELKGGTLITIKTEGPVNIADLQSRLKSEFGSVSVRGFRGFGEYGAIIEVSSDADYELVIQKAGVVVTDYSIENVGPALSTVFWSQTQIAIIVAFIFMGIIAFLVFRILVPSIAIIASAAFDIIITLAFMQLLGIEFSLASLGALLMLIGYSVDTDIMLTTKVLKEEGGSIAEKTRTAFGTGITMTLTSIGAVAALLIIPLPDVLVEIASVLFIGLSIDIINTWFMNSVLLRWYCERRGI